MDIQVIIQYVIPKASLSQFHALAQRYHLSAITPPIHGTPFDGILGTNCRATGQDPLSGQLPTGSNLQRLQEPSKSTAEHYNDSDCQQDLFEL